MDPTNHNTALASAFAEELARGGLRRAVVSPGSRSTPLAVALWREPGIEVTVIVDERSAGFFALGAAQASGEPVALLCTSGTAVANYHPAVAEADLAALPLIVLSADRPPELRDIGAGQTIDQIKTFGEAVRWFCEVGTHEADDSGLLHLRSVACRALARARGEIRPGPVHLNLPFREPLAPIPVEGAVTATDELALHGRQGRPLTAVTRVDLEPTSFVLDEVAGHIGDAIAGVIVVGRQIDPELREPLAHLARASGFPILAEPTSQMRLGPHDRSYVVTTYDTLLRDEHWAHGVVPELVLRFGDLPTSKPLRTWLAASGADQIVVDPSGGWNEPTNRAAAILRADPTECASGWAVRLEKASEAEGRGAKGQVSEGGARGPLLSRTAGRFVQGPPRPAPKAWLVAEEAALTAIAAELDGGGANDGDELSAATDTEASGSAAVITEPALHLALGRAHQDGDLVYTASSMPIRDQETFLGPGEADVLLLCNRGANGIDGLVSSGIGAAHASGRPTTIVTGELGFLHDIGSLAALRDVTTPVRIVVIDNGGGGIFHFLPQQAALETDEFEALLGTPRGVSVERAAALFDLPYRRLESLADLPEALAAGTGLIEVRTNRATNVAAHRRVTERVLAAIKDLPKSS
ncbi:MAG TPA: 2-succinyl-5-enolpyruvyl-6-hydroxy-3-cyclohexene-1-carboxylic-acid synthase [Solirubrobacterales bacterium]|jgi:2-succinyl-5-enolpyruvyl-6-hydroxy-3-cyclohexene-1-carboxylate synthase|nr:2-succinyl-5-enolpyruvyl-6-hydroxy-3-cyclohexene-1-carboxylic-acid synthase [Solirubrobacterales bacterium]